MTDVFVDQMSKRPDIAVDFTPREKKVLFDIMLGNRSRLVHSEVIDFKVNKRFPYILNIRRNYKEITVWKVDDDYFWVKYRFSPMDEGGYVCDQFEGLIRLLKDLGF